MMSEKSNTRGTATVDMVAISLQPTSCLQRGTCVVVCRDWMDTSIAVLVLSFRHAHWLRLLSFPSTL